MGQLVVVLVVLLLAVVGLAGAAAAISGDFSGFIRRLLGAEPNATGAPRPSEYTQVPALLTSGERAFFPVLESALPEVAAHLGAPHMRAFTKVRLADVVEPANAPDRAAHTRALNQIISKHVDFVIVDAASTRPICAVELDDRSHQTTRAARADATKDAALRAAGVPIVRITASRAYEVRALVRDLCQAIEASANHPDASG